MSRARTLLRVTLISLLVAGCTGAATSPGPAASAPASPGATDFEPSQTNEAGQVTVEVSWDGPAAGAVFDVKLDTHSVDLDGLDLSDAELTNDRGDSLAAVPWEAPKGGHHREGRLAFQGDASTFFADAQWIELTFSGVGGVPERVLRWEVPA